MRHEDPNSTNLFARLFKYVPSEGGKRVRRPLEDFCTEALAYCLLHSDLFGRLFLTSLSKNSDASDTPLLVDTQKKIKGGRADLVIETVWKGQQRIRVGEVKNMAPLRESQRAYANFILAPAWYFSLNNVPEACETISWETVHSLLGQSCEVLTEPAEVRNIMFQFSGFLEQHGLKSIKMKSDLYRVSSTGDLVVALDELTEFFFKLRALLKLKRRGNPPAKWDHSTGPGKPSYYGIYGEAGQYAGIEFGPDDKILSFYQEQLFGDMPLSFEEFTCEAGDGGSIWVSSRRPFPPGGADKAAELLQTFAELQDSVRQFAVRKGLKSPVGSELE